MKGASLFCRVCEIQEAAEACQRQCSYTAVVIGDVQGFGADILEEAEEPEIRRNRGAWSVCKTGQFGL